MTVDPPAISRPWTSRSTQTRRRTTAQRRERPRLRPPSAPDLALVCAADPGKGGTFAVRSLVEGNKWAAIILEGLTDVEFDGNGSTLIFSDKVARYLWVDRCKRVAVRNLTFDLDQTYARVGVYAKPLAVDPATRTVTAQLVNGRNGKPDSNIPRRASYWRWPHDPKTLRVGRGGPHFDSGSYAERPVADPAAGPGVIRFKLKHDPGA